MERLKSIGAVLVLSIVCAAAIYQKMEILAVVTVVMIGLVAYRRRARQLLDTGFDVIGRSTKAELGSLKLGIERKSKATDRLSGLQPDWVRAILEDLTGEQVALLTAVFMMGTASAGDNRDKENFRVLRSRGLLAHDKPTMAASTQVWLTDLGKEVASQVTQLKGDQISTIPNHSLS